MESVLQEASSSQQVIIRQDSQQSVIQEEQSELGMLLGHMQSPYVVIIYTLVTSLGLTESIVAIYSQHS